MALRRSEPGAAIASMGRDVPWPRRRLHRKCLSRRLAGLHSHRQDRARAAWEPSTSPDYHRGIGAELVFEPRIGYLFGLQTRAGVARGLDVGGSTKFYLRTGRMF